jgi:hypothetical protein
LLETGLVGITAYLAVLYFYSMYTLKVIRGEVVTSDMLCVFCTQFIFIAWSVTENPVWDVYPFFLYLLTYPILRSSVSCVIEQNDANYSEVRPFVLNQKGGVFG